MRVYYELILWEDIDQNDLEILKGKFIEFGKRLQGFGIMKFDMKATPPLTPEQQQEIDLATQQQQQDAQIESQEEAQLQPQEISESQAEEQEVLEE